MSFGSGKSALLGPTSVAVHDDGDVFGDGGGGGRGLWHAEGERRGKRQNRGQNVKSMPRIATVAI